MGGHLTALRRTRVGSFTLPEARTLEQLEQSFVVTPLAESVARVFPRRDVEADQASAVRHGGWLALSGEDGPTGVFGPDGTVLALMAPKDGSLHPLVVLTPA